MGDPEIPGRGAVSTDVGRDLLDRPVFPAIGTHPRPLGGHIAANGYDLARLEAAAAEQALTAALGLLRKRISGAMLDEAEIAGRAAVPWPDNMRYVDGEWRRT